MLEYLNGIEKRLYERFTTLVTNIKSASNSFYDAYLDMQEELIRIVAKNGGIELEKHESCGAILKREDVKQLFVEKIGIDPLEYNKMGDYALKVNAHKHKGEKHIQRETVVNYITLFYNVSSKYAKHIGLDPLPLDESYISYLFDSYERERERMKREREELKEDIDVKLKEVERKQERLDNEMKRVTNRLSSSPITDNVLELKDFVRDSRQYILRAQDKGSLPKEQIICGVSIFASVAFFIIATILVTLTVEFPSTYSFIEAIWAVLIVKLAFRIVTLKEMTEPVKFNHYFTLSKNKDGIISFTGKKKKYTVTLILAVISSLLNAFVMTVDTDVFIPMSVNQEYVPWVIVFELLFIATSVTAYVFAEIVYSRYKKTIIIGKDERGRRRRMIYNMETYKLYDIDATPDTEHKTFK